MAAARARRESCSITQHMSQLVKPNRQQRTAKHQRHVIWVATKALSAECLEVADYPITDAWGLRLLLRVLAMKLAMSCMSKSGQCSMPAKGLCSIMSCTHSAARSQVLLTMATIAVATPLVQLSA